MMKIHGKLFVCALAAVLLMTASSVAGTINSVPTPTASGPGLGLVAVPAVVTVLANNDNVPSVGVLDNNIVVPVKRFDNADYIDIVFTVTPSGGVTEYAVTEFVDNNTGIPWSSYTMQLGTGFGPGFVKSTAGDGLDFDDPSYDTPPMSTAMPTVITGMTSGDEDELVFTGANQGPGAQLYRFRIDVPDLSTLPAFGTFTLRQIPTPIPEPTAIALAGFALAGFGWYRRSR
jgi:hypothetical protein